MHSQLCMGSKHASGGHKIMICQLCKANPAVATLPDIQASKVCIDCAAEYWQALVQCAVATLHSSDAPIVLALGSLDRKPASA